MTALVSNAALAGSLVALFLVSYILYGNMWVTYVYLMTIWPWVVIATVLARLHIGKDQHVSHFSVFFHLPIMAILGCGSLIGMVIALKNLSVIDCVVLSFLDPIWSSIFHAISINRISYFELHSKSYVALVVLLFLYIYGQAYTGGTVEAYMDSVTFLKIPGTLPVGSYFLFLGSRAASLVRCSYMKYSFIPRQSDKRQTFKSLFPNFPFPIRFRLDVLFDSGLAEDLPHAVGPAGTVDMFLLTDGLYLLPLSSIASWLLEYGDNQTLVYGLSPPQTIIGVPPVGLLYFAFAFFLLGLAILPIGSSKILFDRGSSPHEWAHVSLMILLGYCGLDLLYLNPFISRAQIVAAILMFALSLNYRTDLWQDFKKRYYQASMKELEFLQPSCLRSAQKHTLLDALDKTSIDDFGALLFETAIHHGNNIKDYLKQEDGAKIWDPSVSARAAWKLAGSLVIRAIRARKARIQLDSSRSELKDSFIKSIVGTMVETATNAKSKPN